MRIRRARHHDLPTILCWRKETASWLASIGSDQWSDAGLSQDAFEERVADSIDAGETWIAEDDDATPLGTIAIDSTADPGLWDEDELRHAYVIHRMIIHRAVAGRGIGAILIDHAIHLARQNGRTSLLLDAWTSNHRLHAYYRSQGFHHVRTVPGHYTPSSALFKRDIPPATTITPSSTRPGA